MSTKEHKEIYLEPNKCACPENGGMWCEDSQSCENCGKPWIRYVRADLHNKELEAKDKDHQSLVNKIKDIIDTLSNTPISGLALNVNLEAEIGLIILTLQNLINEDKTG